LVLACAPVVATVVTMTVAMAATVRRVAIRATFISGPFLFERRVVTAVTTDASSAGVRADALCGSRRPHSCRGPERRAAGPE
jgi:hypothetical protein